MKINEDFKMGCMQMTAFVSVFAMFALFAVLIEGLFELIIDIVTDYWFLVVITLIGVYIIYK